MKEYDKALNHIENAKSKDAIERQRKAIEVAPEYAAAHFRLAQIYRNAGDLKTAEEHFALAAEYNSSNAGPLIELGLLYIDRQEYDAAVDVLNQAWERDSTWAHGAYLRGLALYHVGRIDDAGDSLMHARRLDATISGLDLMLANVFIKQNRFEDALAELDHFLENAPESPQRAEVESVRSQILAVLNSGGRAGNVQE